MHTHTHITDVLPFNFFTTDVNLNVYNRNSVRKTEHLTDRRNRQIDRQTGRQTGDFLAAASQRPWGVFCHISRDRTVVPDVSFGLLLSKYFVFHPRQAR